MAQHSDEDWDTKVATAIVGLAVAGVIAALQVILSAVFAVYRERGAHPVLVGALVGWVLCVAAAFAAATPWPVLIGTVGYLTTVVVADTALGPKALPEPEEVTIEDLLTDSWNDEGE